MFGWDFEDKVWLRFLFVHVMWPIRLLWKDELNPWVRCAFGNVFDGKTLIRTLDSQFSWIFDIFEKVAMETFTIRIAQVLWRYARRKDDIFKAFLSERLPLASLHRAKPGATFAVLYQAILGVEGLPAPSPPAGKFLLLPVLVEPVRKEKLLIVFVARESIQIWCVLRLDEGIGRVKWIMEISVFFKVNIMLKPPLT